jgi:uncharacterized membrane protein
MMRLVDFARRTLISGVLILLPILLLYLALAEVAQLVVGLATPIADLLPKTWFATASAPVVGVGLLLTASLLLGLLARSESGKRIGRWIEARTLARLPLYSVLKSLTAALVEIDDGAPFRPVLLVDDNGDREIAYLVEDRGDACVTVMLPWAPTPFAGSVKIVRRERLRMLGAGLGDVTRVLSHWGEGALALADNAKERTASTAPNAAPAGREQENEARMQ